MTDWNKYCISCLSVKESFKYILHENISAETYWFCTSIQILKDEKCPKSLCDDCYRLVIKFSDFKTKCMQSHKTLINRTNTHEFEYLVELEHETKSIKQETDAECCDNEFSETTDIEEKLIIDERQKKLKSSKKSKACHIKVRKQFPYSCKLCSKRFVFCDRYEAHMMEHEGKVIPIHCLPCNKTFKNWSSLKLHKDVEHTTVSLDSLKCNICGKILKSQQTLRLHQKIHGKRNMFVCDVCGKQFTTHANLKLHMNTHQENWERRYTCECCGKKFFANSLLQSHISKRHRGRKFVCQICNYPFTDKYNLVKHLLKHEGKKIHKCDICFKSYAAQSTLVEHKRIHSGERPYICSYCPKNFMSKRILNDHHKTHTGERPHKCNVCEQTFTQRGTLNRHMKVHEKLEQVTK